MWGYYWGLTAAQIELMAIDTPIIVYDKDKDANGKKKFKKPNELDIINTALKWNAKYADKKDDEKISINLKGFQLPTENNVNS